MFPARFVKLRISCHIDVHYNLLFVVIDRKGKCPCIALLFLLLYKQELPIKSEDLIDAKDRNKVNSSHMQYTSSNFMKEQFIDSIKKELKHDMLVISCGLPASGKTTLIKLIAGIKEYKILSTDLIRLELLKDENIFDPAVASNMDKRMLVYDKMFKMANECAGKGEGVILDGTFITRALRMRAADVAAEYGMTFLLQETRCSRDVCIRRILQRTKDDYESNALTEEAYMNNLKRFEAVDIHEIKKHHPDLNIIHLIIDTTSDNPDEWFIIKREAC